MCMLWLTGSCKSLPYSEMTYNVLMGTLNPTNSFTRSLTHSFGSGSVSTYNIPVAAKKYSGKIICCFFQQLLGISEQNVTYLILPFTIFINLFHDFCHDFLLSLQMRVYLCLCAYVLFVCEYM